MAVPESPRFIHRLIVSLVRAYARRFPINKGKYPLEVAALRLCGRVNLIGKSRRGWSFSLHFPEDRGWEDLCFRGEFETGSTDLVSDIVRPSDVVFDIGANLGWYTVHLAKRLKGGVCHAFEPMPSMFERLKGNCAVNGLGDRIILNPVALGPKAGIVELHYFEELGAGQSSVSTLGRTSAASVQVQQSTLDQYLQDHHLDRVDFIKMDVEGAELGVLEGGKNLLELHPAPTWLIEMNEETSRSFGYRPEELLRKIKEHGTWHFFRIVQGWGKTFAMASEVDYEHGDNVLCVSADRPDILREVARLTSSGA